MDNTEESNLPSSYNYDDNDDALLFDAGEWNRPKTKI